MIQQVLDQFNTGGRGTPNAWSPASSGNWNWAQLAGSATLNFVQGQSEAQLSGNTSANVMALGGNLYYYTNVVATHTKATATASVMGTLARVADFQTYYSATFQSGVLTLSVMQGGTAIVLGTYAFSETVNTPYQVRLQVAGQITNTVSAKIWTGGTEPSSYQITVAGDTHITAPGLPGVYGQAASSGETLSYSAFLAQDAPGYSNQLGATPYGMNLQANPGSDPTGIQMLRDAVNAGYTWIRWQFTTWAMMEPSPGVFDYTQMDAAVQACNAVGMNILVTIRAGAAWATINPCGLQTSYMMDPTKLTAFLTGPGGLLHHYNLGTAGTIQALDIGNEDYEQGGACASGTLAAQLMVAVYPAVKALVPTMIVGGPAQYMGPKITPNLWNEFFAAGGGANVDFLNIHSYPCVGGPGPNDPNSQTGQTVTQALQQVQQVALTNGYGNLPIWMTENGWAPTNSSCLTPPVEQALYYQQILDDFRAIFPIVTKHFWYEMGNLTTGDGSTERYRHAYGMLQSYVQQYPQWTPSGGQGGPLPGQQISNGVSNYLWGTNQPDYNETLLSNTAVQQQLKTNGVTVIRCPVEIGGTNCTDAQLDQLATACANVGASMLCILRYNDGTNNVFNEHVVAYLGSRCNLYEFSNEPDLNSITWEQYLTAWNALIPACRTINASAAFIGPALGAYSNVQAYLVPWLQGCVSSGVVPDGVSWHDYPCTSNSSIPQSTCLTWAAHIGSDASTLQTTVNSIMGKNVPLCLTEWNIDAYYGNSHAQSYSTNIPANAAFITQWTTAAMDGMVSAGVALACEFELNAYLVNDSNPSQSEPQLAAMYAEEQKYLGGGSGGSGTGSVDTFVRANQTGFGTASDGETWTAQGAGTLSIVSDEGVIVSTGADTSVTLGTDSLTNMDVYGRFAVGAGLDVCGLTGRYSVVGSDNQCYKLLWYTGTLNLNKRVSGANSYLANVGFVMTPGAFYQFHLHCNGTTIAGSIWPDGTAEPATYLLTATDTAIASGGYGVLANTATGSPGVQVDHFAAGDGAPQATLSPASLAYSAAVGGGNPAAESVQLTNAGNGAASYSTSIAYSGGASGWLSTTNAAGLLTPGQAVTQTYSAIAAGLAAGTYSATVTVGFQQSLVTLSVTLTVTGGSGGSGSYDSFILGLNAALEAYWRLADASSVLAQDSSGHGYTATLVGATPSQPGLIVGDPDTSMHFTAAGSLLVPNTLQDWTFTQLSLVWWTNLDGGDGTHMLGVTVGPVSQGVGTLTSLYLDGTPVSSTPGGTISIGGLLDYAGSLTTAGRMGKVALWSTSLSAAQILSVYLAGTATPPPPPPPPPGIGSGSIMDLHQQKIQQVKIYDSYGNYLGIWLDAPLVTGLKDTIDACQSPVKLVLPRKIDAFDGQNQSPFVQRPPAVWGGFRYGYAQWSTNAGATGGNAVVQGNTVKVYLYGPGLPASGLLKFQGYIDTIEPTITDRNAESVTVTITPFNAAIADSGYGGQFNFTSVDPLAIFNYWFTTIDPIAGGGVPYVYPLTLASGEPTSSGLLVNFSALNQKVKSVFDMCMLILGDTWYWRPNSDNTVTIKQLNIAPDHTLILGQHLASLSWSVDTSQRYNVIYFVGATGIAAHAVGASAKPIGQGGIGAKYKFLQDSRITDTPTAQVIADSQLALYDQTFVRAKCRVLDYRGDSKSSLGADIEAFHVGDTVTIQDGRDKSNPTQWGNFKWGQAQYGISSGSIFNTVVPIMGITYGWHYVDLELGSLQPSQDRRLFQIEKRVGDFQLGM